MVASMNDFEPGPPASVELRWTLTTLGHAALADGSLADGDGPQEPAGKEE